MKVNLTFNDGYLTKTEVEGVTLPLGCKVVDYRVPRAGEQYLDFTGKVNTEEVCGEVFTEVPIIVDEVKQIYGKPYAELKPPNGYVFTGEFRTLQYQDCFLAKWGFPCTGSPSDNDPRLILAPAPRPQRITFEVVGRDRVAEPGEYKAVTLKGDIHQPVEPPTSVPWPYLLRRITD